MKKHYWIELIGFDKDCIEQSVQNFIDKQQGRIDSVFLLLYDIDFINDHQGMENEYFLKRMECSYNGHEYNAERKIQRWTNYDLKKLIDVFHLKEVKVFCSVLNMAVGRGEDGEGIATSTLLKNPELQEFCSKKYAYNYGSINVLKRFKSGGYFEDYFISNLIEVLVDYGFDGYHIADGISSGRLRVPNGDFSDDMVEQFLAHTKIVFPNDIPLITKNKKEHLLRYRFIIENYRYEWMEFISNRFAEFFKKVVDKSHAVGKLVYFNNTWTCSPFEAYYRYGIDYRKLAKSGVDAMIFEDTGGSGTLLSYESLWVQPSEERRKFNQMRFRLSQMALKLSTDIPIYNMTTLQDNEEQWNFIDNDFNEYRSMIARRSIAYIESNQSEYTKGCDGSLYCLSDGLEKNVWDSIHQTENIFDFQNVVGAYGFTAIYVENFEQEAKKFISNKGHYAESCYYELIKSGLPICAMAKESDIAKLQGNIVAFTDMLNDDSLKCLEEENEKIIVAIGYDKRLSKKPMATFACGDLKILVYNTKKEAKGLVQGYKKAPQTEILDCHWPERLRQDFVNPKLFEQLLDYLCEEEIFPYIIKPSQVRDYAGKKIMQGWGKLDKEDCRIFTYKTDEKKVIAVVFNMQTHYVSPFIKIPFSFESVRVLGKPHWHSVQVFPNNVVHMQLTQRNVEVLEFTLK